MIEKAEDRVENTNYIRHCIRQLTLFDKIMEGNPGNWQQMVNYDELEHTVKMLLLCIEKDKEPE